MLIIYVFALIFGPFCYADADYQYFQYRYDIKPVESSRMSADECEALLEGAIFYNIVGGKSIYRENKKSNFKILSYKRLSSMALNANQVFYTGEARIQFKHNGQLVDEKELLSFVLDRQQKMIRGRTLIPNYCQTAMIGVDTSSLPLA